MIPEHRYMRLFRNRIAAGYLCVAVKTREWDVRNGNTAEPRQMETLRKRSGLHPEMWNQYFPDLGSEMCFSSCSHPALCFLSLAKKTQIPKVQGLSAYMENFGPLASSRAFCTLEINIIHRIIFLTFKSTSSRTHSPSLYLKGLNVTLRPIIETHCANN